MRILTVICSLSLLYSLKYLCLPFRIVQHTERHSSVVATWRFGLETRRILLRFVEGCTVDISIYYGKVFVKYGFRLCFQWTALCNFMWNLNASFSSLFSVHFVRFAAAPDQHFRNLQMIIIAFLPGSITIMHPKIQFNGVILQSFVLACLKVT